jgi:uncharacterized protein YjiS (DUF1127 family)
MTSETIEHGHSPFGRLCCLIATWAERHLHRHHLGAFDERLLEDVGLTRAECDHEHRKPFWKE